MKTGLTKFLAFSGLALLMLASCKKNDVLVKSNGGKAGTLSVSQEQIVLDKSKVSDTSTVITFNFTAPEYGFSAAVTNTLEIDSLGDDWKKPTSVTLGAKALSQGYSTADFNALLLKLNLPADAQSQIQVRVVHTISSNLTPQYSNVITMAVTPFNLISYVYVPGAYQGWNIANPDSLVSLTGNGVYTGIINFPAGDREFLITPKKAWDHKYATNDPTGNTSSTVKYDGPNNFWAPADAGQYWVTINTNTNTISFTKVDYYYSAIGDALPPGQDDWGHDIDLKFVNGQQQDWEATITLQGGKGFKIRRNHDWGTAFGTDDATYWASNGGNISVPSSGTYKITFKIDPTTATASPILAFYTFVKQ